MNDKQQTDDGRDQVEVLADEFFERQAAGESVTIDDYVQQYPDIADDIREVFPALEALRSLSSEWKKNVVDRPLGPELPFQLGDYRLERQIGHGGMGIVYEAEHTSLRRRVAVKLLRSFSLSTERDVERFHQEAKSAAKLHHTNIVPVFDFGEAQGYHFIAMQLIQGQGLDVAVERMRSAKEDEEAKSATPGDLANVNSDFTNTKEAQVESYGTSAYWRQIAEFGVQTAHALGYAHSQGTVHRDVKPANLLLDNAGVVWVADFGLARQDEDGVRTQTGIVSGTLRYLSPEQFRGQCDERSDQYGLGLSLYELATLSPVTGDSRNQAEIMRRIAEARVVPPRQLNASIPRDLETIILKAIASEPKNRFPNCAALAEDLERFVDGQPVLSRPVSVAEKVWRWAKRYPALAAATTTSVVLLALVAIVAVLGFQAERLQRQRAEKTSRYALEALDTVFDSFASSQQSAGFLSAPAAAAPVLSMESANLLERLLPIIDRLAELDDQSQAVRIRAASARKRVAEIHERLGHYDEAVESYERAIDEWPRTSSKTETALRISDIYNSIGTCQLMQGRIEEARHSHERALYVLRELQDPTDDVRFQLARTHFLLSRRLRPGESPVETRPLNRPGRPGDNRRPPRDFGVGHREHLQEAISLLDTGEESAELHPRDLHLLAVCLQAMLPEGYSRKSAEQLASEDRAIGILKQLTTDYPAVSDYQHSYVAALATIDTHRPDSITFEDLPKVSRRLQTAIEHGETLVANHPYVPQYTLTLIHSHNRLGHIFERQGWDSPRPESNRYFEQAVYQFTSAANLQSVLAKRYPSAEAYRIWQGQFELAAKRIRSQLDAE